ncbi:MAG: TIGR00730 family Rossman fold protein [Bacteroidales bacterium]
MDTQPLAYLMRDFLESEEGRPIRILSEYLEPLQRFREQNIQDTVVFFGSARVHSRDWARRALADAMRHGAPSDTAALRRRERALDWARYYEDARRLAAMLTRWSLSLGTGHNRFVVCSGGGPGIMEAANRGAREVGGKTIGLNIRLPFEQGVNPYVTPGLHFEFHYFFMRKFWFAYLAKALVVFPGGFGTLDEMFEILTLAQTEKLSKKIGVLIYGRDYWDQVIDMQPMVDYGAIGEEDLALMNFADTPEDAFEFLKAHLTEHHMQPATAQEEQAPGLAKTRG